MRTSLFAPALLAMLITVGAGCAATTDTQVDVSAEVDAGAAGGTQLEGTPAVNDTPEADINLEGDAAVEVDAGAGAEVDADVDVSVGATKTFTVTAGNFAYDVKEMKVKKGDKVRIVFKNAEGFHDWVLDEFSAKTAKHQAGGEETIEFTADKTGTFEYYCSVGSHRAMGMKGNLIVE